MFKKARTQGKKPNWMGDIVWNGLLEKWNMPLYRQKCETTKKNRTSDKGGCLHTRGSTSVLEHIIRLELGRSVHVDEIFQQTHIRASTGEFVDESGRYKGRVYGIGNVSAQDDCVDSYIQQTQASSSQQSIVEDIFNLHTRVSTRDDQLRQMNSQLQGFIGVIMQYLPPPAVAIAQQFFQSQNQPQTNVQPQQPHQPQQPQQPIDQPQDENVYGDY
ncbi:hypothetical protein LR48_Vigan07g179200 [Vigna angularis]|uniref:Uncharacterized protein n=1 Tax=Phaseolus angularis TaxID=3914 RepID=A0A0L9UZ89_PHAAN|nr:hypothetical protein LR48_Vigan07g179200 [Vigna angularis]